MFIDNENGSSWARYRSMLIEEIGIDPVTGDPILVTGIGWRPMSTAGARLQQFL